MHFRRDRQRVNGKTYTSLSIVHAVTEDAPVGRRSKPITFANLGNEDQISEKHAEQLMRSLERYMEKRWGKKPLTAREVKEAARVVKKQERTLRMLVTKDLGMRLLLEAAWRELGIGKVLTGFEKHRRVEFDFERIVFAMVLNRLSAPGSKYACNEWAKDAVYLPEAKDWDVHHFYRAMDVLHEHWDELETHLEQQLWDTLTPAEQRLRLVDTTRPISTRLVHNHSV